MTERVAQQWEEEWADANIPLTDAGLPVLKEAYKHAILAALFDDPAKVNDPERRLLRRSATQFMRALMSDGEAKP